MFTESVRVGYSFPACCLLIGKISNMFDISPTLHNSVATLWLCPPGNRPVMDLYGLSLKLPILSYTVIILS